jgi:Xaa-Pro dipeptidase
MNRIETLSASLPDLGLDAIMLNPGPSLAYLTGLQFHLMERPVVLFVAAGKTPVIVLPELEKIKLEALPFAVEGFPYGEDPSTWGAVFAQAMGSLGLTPGKRVGVEPMRLRLLEFDYAQAAGKGLEFVPAGEAVGRLRLRKDAQEVDAMRKAVKCAQDALEAVLPSIRLGMTEKEIAGELVVQLFRHSADPELPFAPIVSGGPNAANPHASPGARPLQAGDLLVIDWGACVDGYVADLTRTFAVGRVDAEWEKIHKIVQQANAAGRATAKPGAPCAAVDRAARDVIEAAGYGDYFIHRTGHGIGLEPHEDPYMRGDNLQIMKPGMAFTVEPGIYLPGRNGVRIEDNLVITADGAECLSDMEREIRVVG